MTRIVDPPRLLELADTPSNLCKLLQDARGDGLSAAEIEQLIHVAGTLAEPSKSGLFLADQLMPQAAAPSGILGLFTAGKFFATVVVALSTSALGVAGWSISHGGALANSTLRSKNASSLQSSPSKQIKVAPDEGSDTSSAKGEVQATPAVVGVTPQPREASTQVRRAATRYTAPPPKAPIVAMPDPEEFRVLQAAREELPNSPARALVLAESHARRFSRGMLDQERETIAIEALARLGRADEASGRSKAFLSRFPASPYRSRVEAAISSLAK